MKLYTSIHGLEDVEALRNTVVLFLTNEGQDSRRTAKKDASMIHNTPRMQSFHAFVNSPRDAIKY